MNIKHYASCLVRGNGPSSQFLNLLLRKWLHCNGWHRQNLLSRNIHANRCSSKTLSQLTSRAVIRLSGPDTVNFLQGLITNDVHQLTQDSAQYAMMLNVQGRVMYDLFLYNISKDTENQILLMEVDDSAKGELIKTLKRYKLRKKVDISDCSNEFQVWSKFKVSTDSNVSIPKKPIPEDVVIVTVDPRVPSFGKRIIRQGHNDEWIRNAVDESVYRRMRYQWGIPEGPVDLPPGNCFPLESNLAFMNGVDFQKGCYIGQELTARTHHTGVTRKRIMPLSLNGSQSSMKTDATVVTAKGRNAGKIRSQEEGYGLGLIRLAYIDEELSLKNSDEETRVKAHVPGWWPPFDKQI